MFKFMTASELARYLAEVKVNRRITHVQLHHTWLPNYGHFDGSNHVARQAAMRDAHLNRGFADIAQHFTIFPDGLIGTGRSLDEDPAGIKGHNKGGICIENFGNFDAGHDVMRAEQQRAIVETCALLMQYFNLRPEKDIVYHGWFTSSGKPLGTYDAGRSAKTCPGTGFFGGNTRRAYEENLLPRILKRMKGEDDTMTQRDFNKMMGKYLDERRKEGLSHWAINAWDSAVKTGLVDGNRPHDFVTREEMTVMFDRWFDKLMGLIAERRQQEVSAWAKEDWESAVKRGVTDGTRPCDWATREEMVVMLGNWFGKKKEDGDV